MPSKNELNNRKRKHLQTNTKKAQGWFTTLGGNPEVEKNFFNRATSINNDSTENFANTDGASTSVGETAMGESFLNEEFSYASIPQEWKGKDPVTIMLNLMNAGERDFGHWEPESMAEQEPLFWYYCYHYYKKYPFEAEKDKLRKKEEELLSWEESEKYEELWEEDKLIVDEDNPVEIKAPVDIFVDPYDMGDTPPYYNPTNKKGIVQAYLDNGETEGFFKLTNVKKYMYDLTRAAEMLEWRAQWWAEEFGENGENLSESFEPGYTVLTYKDYGIDYNIYGGNEYSVQYSGDDYIFNTLEEAKAFINSISEYDDSMGKTFGQYREEWLF